MYHQKIFEYKNYTSYRYNGSPSNDVQHVLARNGMDTSLSSCQLTEDGITTETDLKVKILLWNRHIIYPTSHEKFLSNHYIKHLIVWQCW